MTLSEAREVINKVRTEGISAVSMEEFHAALNISYNLISDAIKRLPVEFR